jgi:glycosyltransferase involved in cell wall biosynthesis
VSATAAGGPVVVDCAGAQMGGALRFLEELDAYLGRRPSRDVRVIGRGRRVDPSWLLRRERLAPHRRAVALNNVGFVAARGDRWVLLRNMLHFLSDDETRRLPAGLPPGVARTARVVRMCARRADVVVVPSTDMAERVGAAVPGLSRRVVVRPHPLSVPPPVPPGSRKPHLLLCPVLFAPFKAMGSLLRLADLAAADLAATTGADLVIAVTATEREAAAEGLDGTRHLRFLGRLSPRRLAVHQRTCRALVYPTRIESFGYPLAEARLAGLPVVAADTPRNREIAGPVLAAYRREDPADLAEAMHRALKATPQPEEVNPFAPDRYFDWLLDARTEDLT